MAITDAEIHIGILRLQREHDVDETVAIDISQSSDLVAIGAKVATAHGGDRCTECSVGATRKHLDGVGAFVGEHKVSLTVAIGVTKHRRAVRIGTERTVHAGGTHRWIVKRTIRGTQVYIRIAVVDRQVLGDHKVGLTVTVHITEQGGSVAIHAQRIGDR